MTVGEVMIRQFVQMWETFRETIANFTDEQWKKADIDWQIPARLASHAIEGADYYARANPEGYDPKVRFGAYWESEPEQLLDREATLKHLGEIQNHVETWLRSMSDLDLLSPNSGFQPWEEAWGSILERAVYLLRHAQHHLGQLTAELRRRGLSSAEWR